MKPFIAMLPLILGGPLAVAQDLGNYDSLLWTSTPVFATTPSSISPVIASLTGVTLGMPISTTPATQNNQDTHTLIG